MIYVPEMRTKYEKLFAWYLQAGGNTPTAPEECFQLYRWLFTIGMNMQHVYYHSKVEDQNKPYLIVELGSGLGASSILMARGFQDGNTHCPLKVLGRLVTVDNGAESDVGRTKAVINKAIAEFGVDIDFRVGRDLDVLSELPDGSVDFLFTDAQHGYDDVTGALDLAVTKVVHNGRLAGHDYDLVELSVVRAVEDWRKRNQDKVVGWATYDSLWWMVKE